MNTTLTKAAVGLLLLAGAAARAEKGDLDNAFLDRELQRTKPHYVIYRPHAEAKYDDHGNEHLHVFRGKDGSLCALWTMSRHEGTFTQRPVFAKSRDDGRTWSEPKCILNDPIDPKTGRNMGSWAAAAYCVLGVNIKTDRRLVKEKNIGGVEHCCCKVASHALTK